MSHPPKYLRWVSYCLLFGGSTKETYYEDLKDMVVFPVNPLNDFAVDLAELWKMQCSVEEMLKMGIRYLISKGITPAIMAAFRLPMSSWVELGFTDVHTRLVFQNAETQMVFGLE